MKLVKPQHFLPVHGEYSFLTAHAQLAKDVGIKNTSVIRNGQMLGVHHRRNGNEVSTTGASVKGMQLLGDVKLRMLYNDGNKVCCDTLTECFWFQSHHVHTYIHCCIASLASTSGKTTRMTGDAEKCSFPAVSNFVRHTCTLAATFMTCQIVSDWS